MDASGFRRVESDSGEGAARAAFRNARRNGARRVVGRRGRARVVTDLRALQEDIETLAATPEGTALPSRAGDVIESLLAALEAGTVRSASKGDDSAWRANAWVKRGILL